MCVLSSSLSKPQLESCAGLCLRLCCCFSHYVTWIIRLDPVNPHHSDYPTQPGSFESVEFAASFFGCVSAGNGKTLIFIDFCSYRSEKVYRVLKRGEIC